jgi:hypothetical protein
MRTPRNVYVDPLDAIWLAVARGFGLRVARSAEVYASTDGEGTLTLGTPETLDPDDCLAQMIFHELCHALVQGEAHLTSPDWGLDNESERDVAREHACLRVQAALAGEYGLRGFLAPTTDFRAAYDALPKDPLEGEGEAIALAREAYERASRPPWAPHLRRGLDATRRVLDVVREMNALDEGGAGELRSLNATFAGDAGDGRAQPSRRASTHER